LNKKSPGILAGAFLLILVGWIFNESQRPTTQAILPPEELPRESQSRSFKPAAGSGFPRGKPIPTLKRLPAQQASQFFQEMAEFAARHGKAAIPELRKFLNDPDWQVRCAALRALACTRDPEAASILESFIRDDKSIEESAQATLALSQMETPGVAATLAGQYQSIRSPELQSCLLDALASRSTSETGSFFPVYLNSAEIPSEQKAEVLKSLGFHKQAPLEWITSYMDSSDEDLRDGAYQALAARGNSSLGGSLLAKIGREENPGIRASLYEAIGTQMDAAPYQLAQAANQERDSTAKIRAYKAWGRAVGRSQNVQDAAAFAQSAIPRLVETALRNSDPGERRAALQALAAAHTPEAGSALAAIASETSSPKLSALAQKLSESIKPR
jgi:HEAT repeat protein